MHLWEACAADARGTYFDSVPLLFTRMLQIQLYASALGATPSTPLLTSHFANARANETLASVFAKWEGELAALAATINPRDARRHDQQRGIDAALSRYRLCGRSGLYDAASLGRGPALLGRRPPDRDASMHVHLHLTHHGGTTMGVMALHGTCQLLYQSNQAAILPQHGTLERQLLDLEANISKQAEALLVPGVSESVRRHICHVGRSTLCNATRDDLLRAQRDWQRRGLSSSAPVDFGQFEPLLPRDAPVGSDRIVWSANVRHPSLWVAKRLSDPFYDPAQRALGSPNFMLGRWLDETFPADHCLGLVAVGRRDPAARCERWNASQPAVRSPTRADLARAKDLARGFAILADVERRALCTQDGGHCLSHPAFLIRAGRCIRHGRPALLPAAPLAQLRVSAPPARDEQPPYARLVLRGHAQPLWARCGPLCRPRGPRTL
jgi:hypothetical protein